MPSPSQRERIAMIKVALMNKIGEGGIKHYGLESTPKPSIPPSSVTPAQPSAQATVGPESSTVATRPSPVDQQTITNTTTDTNDASSGMYL